MNSEQEIYERINQRRRQLLVNSFLYYQLNMNIINDHTYDKFAQDLIQLQDNYPEIADKCIYAEAFKGYQMGGSFALPFSDPIVQEWANGFLRSYEYCKKNGLII